MLKQEDIAKLAGVSRTTVSRVLNNEENVKEDTRNKILKIIETHGYEKNYISSTLASKNEKIVYVFLLKSIVGHYSKELKRGLEAIESENRKFGYKIEIIETSIDEPEAQLEELDKVLNTKKPAGIIITPLLKDKILKRAKKNSKVKFLSLDNSLCKNISHIGANYYNSGQISGDIIKGILRENENVLILKFPGDKISAEEYYKGFASSIQKEQIEVVDVQKNILEKENFLKDYLHENIKGIFFNRYTFEILEKNKDLLKKENSYKIVAIAGNPLVNDYVKNEIVYASINEQFSTIGYNAGKMMFEALYKDKKNVEHEFIKPIVAFKSLI
ncbi:LacI family DNA-binding transcriptional regulator [Candidatus Cetobacterium colombiensis]|uniref:LacI family DNA-binding transcriptional regulator n=1 Tax=Candidatus Cetobacterium colombiensis TaxID=3073100 RepID=A0ABU4WDR2_9FUSO|nr:LacI family DNA-binding transcriptional regulator [Candidatus Cetobacterium colombiensis]MDX8337162.1 LacI family DNA-binding transcriptional regulator [Candidatus Cetobacterium colombiensis]